MINGSTTGGAGGTTVTVTNGTDFITQATTTGPRIIQVQGALTIGSVSVKSDKTILGLGTNATLVGRLSISGVSNIIVRDLRITSPGNDGISIRDPNTHHIWVDHVTFYDCGDGSCDISQGADYVTVSWCKFIYPTQLEHRFAMIADGQAGNTNSGRITLHHNWWGYRADQRMAASSYARVHYYNNYFNCTNNSYSSNARTGTEMNSENNYYSGVKDPIGISSGTDGKIKTSGNLYPGCSGTIHPGVDIVFTPPYAYTPDATADVPSLVQNGAGAPGPETVPIPSKIWDGGGTDNNLNTANNWGYAGGYNETPKAYDVMLFAGSTRLSPNNNFAANSEYAALNFSNNAGAFVLGGSALNVGVGITNDSGAVQTINLNLGFSYAIEHFSTNRVFAVNSNTGTLVINGSLAGPAPTYTTNVTGMVTNIATNYVGYAMIKQGPGMLILNGISSWYGPLSINGGTLRFGTLTPNGAGGLGLGPGIHFNGGTLQWRTNNAADISARLVTINAGGATLDLGTNDVTFASRIGNNGTGGLTKLGTGKLQFNATNNYRGNTLIAEGTLALGLTGLLTNSPKIILSNNATLDVSARSDGTQTLLAGRSLVGSGTVRGSITAASGSTLTPGHSIGTLVITNVLTFQSNSTNVMELDAASHTNDLITGMASVNYGGQLVLTNLDGAFAAGDSFKLFGAGTYNGTFASIIWPPLTGALVWTNKLAVDGTIGVIAPVNTTPTNLVYEATSGMLTLNWPEDHISWRLEVQTNALDSGLTTNWFPLGYETTNTASFPIDPSAGSVFYRLTYP
jgi:autotransporter-associated beta strand protein